MARAQIVSGPLEGMTVTPDREKFAHLELVVLKRKAPTDETELYELIDGEYHHAGNRWRVCDCGGIVRKVEGNTETVPCPLCGALP